MNIFRNINWWMGRMLSAIGLRKGYIYFVDIMSESRVSMRTMQVSGWTLLSKGTKVLVHSEELKSDYAFMVDGHRSVLERLYDSCWGIGQSYLEWNGQTLYRSLTLAEADRNVKEVLGR